MAETGDYTGDLNDLTPIQRRNLLAYRIRKMRTQQAYGNKIKLVTPESEILDEDRPMAIPLTDLSTNKQVVMRFDEVKEYPDGTTDVICDREHQPLPPNTEDIEDALKRTLYDAQMALKVATDERKRKARAIAAGNYEVPKGFKLVPIEEGEEEAGTVPETLGVAVAAQKHADDASVTGDTRQGKIQDLIDQLLSL